MFNFKNKIQALLTLSFIILFLLLVKQSLAQVVTTNEGGDAIAVRIIQNPNHYSVARWYANQGFQGSPQSLVVDGYEAIRDGRTVYVNAANVTSTSIYTNIYLISYNQEPGVKTVDILGQLIAHWKFNNNLVESSDPAPSCSISALSCGSDSDCSKEQQCADSSSLASSSCVLKETKHCLVDTDCPTNFFCDSLKAKISRDMQRLGRVGELQEAIYKFKENNEHYPLLSAGTYLANYSISVWPSWSQVLLSDLVTAQSLSDPVNRLGACSGFDLKTCWNKDAQQFVNPPLANASGDNVLKLPEGSYAFVYSTNNNGSRYNLCSTLETQTTPYRFSPNDPLLNSPCLTVAGAGGQASNTPPELVSQSLSGPVSQEFTGYIEVLDRDNDPLTWKLTTSSSSNWAGWSQGPILKDTSNPNQKKIYAAQSGGPGTYNLNLEVKDGRGGDLNTSTPIKILSSLPFIEAENGEYVLDPTIPVNYSFFFTSPYFNNAANFYQVDQTAGSFNLLADLNKTFSSLGSNKYEVNYSGLIPLSRKFYQTADSAYQIKVIDKYGNSSIKNFKIKVIVNNPLLNWNCDASVRLNSKYECLLGLSNQGNYSLDYSTIGSLPSWLTLGITSTSTSLFGTPTATSSFPVNIKVTNDYGASSSKSFILQTNNYCGDGKKQSPNTEGRGGLYNDGREDCDGAEGITKEVSDSNISLQYGCQTGIGSTTPNPILTNDYCVFRSPVNEGGYCGDGYCQRIINKSNRENCFNCPVDCGVCLTSDILTNVDFETIATGTGFPIDWAETHYYNAMVSVSTSTARSGQNSVWLHQDPDYYWPGTCNEITCNHLAAAAPYGAPYCSWAASTCSFSDVDQNGHSSYANGSPLVWGNANRVMWGNVHYSIGSLDFKKDDIYLVSFYYRGTTTNPLSVSLSSSIGWDNECGSMSDQSILKPGWSWTGSTITPALAPGDNPCKSNFGAPCADQPGHCCAQAPFQRKCYGSGDLLSIEAGHYASWHKYTGGFVFDDEINSWVAISSLASSTIVSTSPLTYLEACPAGGCRRSIDVGIRMNYGSTTNLDPNTGDWLKGTDFYIDDFAVQKVIVK